MNNQANDENDWIGTRCDSSETCPKEGFWKLIETGETFWHEVGDKFSGLGGGINYKRSL